MVARRSPNSNGAAGEGVARLTGAQVSAINRFPDDNPNPVMRVDAGGCLIYANPASAPILRTLGIAVGDDVPAAALARLEAAASSRSFVEFVADSRTYAVWPVRIPDLAFTNLYGTDVTAERAIVKFPDQNPNPVFRILWDGTLAYANPASAELLQGLRLEVGGELPVDQRMALLDRVRSGTRETMELNSNA
jgi:hypothetical protein